jgi:hypothetical protein
MHQELLEMWQPKTSCTCCIDLDKLIDAGSFISNVLDRESRSKVAKAMTAKRNQS